MQEITNLMITLLAGIGLIATTAFYIDNRVETKLLELEQTGVMVIQS